MRFLLALVVCLLVALSTVSAQAMSENGCQGVTCPTGQTCFENGQVFPGGPNGATCCPAGFVGCGRQGGLNIICINAATQSCCVPSGTAQVVPIACNKGDTCATVDTDEAQCVPPSQNTCTFSAPIVTRVFDFVAQQTTICWRIKPASTNGAGCFLRAFNSIALGCYRGDTTQPIVGPNQPIVSAQAPPGCEFDANPDGTVSFNCQPATIPAATDAGNTACLTFNGAVNLVNTTVAGVSSVTSSGGTSFVDFSAGISLPSCPIPAKFSSCGSPQSVEA